MSDTSRREFLSGAAQLAGVSAAAAAGVPGVALGAVRESAGKSAITTPANAIVETSAGKVRGYVRNGIFTFKGIPYAGTTAGDARFLPPAPVTPWTQVRASMSYGPVCPQPVRGGWASDRLAFLFDWDDGHPGEDCLRLNVWTPIADDRNKRPVMVWLHGGGYEAGSSQELPSYDGENLSRRGDVVVVSVNHRLNVFGYLNMAAVGGEKYARSANVGMLDLVAALHWVRDNVGRFGGDPANVTIFGQSGGGAKVSTLMAMPAAKGLFHKAIVQSGSQLRLATADASAAQAAAVLKELQAQGIGVEQLTQVPAARLVEIATVAKNKLTSTNPRAPIYERLGWQPVARRYGRDFASVRSAGAGARGERADADRHDDARVLTGGIHARSARADGRMGRGRGHEDVRSEQHATSSQRSSRGIPARCRSRSQRSSARPRRSASRRCVRRNCKPRTRLRISTGSRGRRRCSTARRSLITAPSSRSRSTTSIAARTRPAARRKRASWPRR